MPTTAVGAVGTVASPQYRKDLCRYLCPIFYIFVTPDSPEIHVLSPGSISRGRHGIFVTRNPGNSVVQRGREVAIFDPLPPTVSNAR